MKGPMEQALEHDLAAMTTKPAARDIPTPRSGGGHWVTSLDTEIGHSKRHGGSVQTITLREWLSGDNRTPQYRARRMTLALIEHQASDITTLLERERRLIEALTKCAEPHRWHAPCISCGEKMVEAGCYIARAALTGMDR